MEEKSPRSLSADSPLALDEQKDQPVDPEPERNHGEDGGTIVDEPTKESNEKRDGSPAAMPAELISSSESEIDLKKCNGAHLVKLTVREKKGEKKKEKKKVDDKEVDRKSRKPSVSTTKEEKRGRRKDSRCDPREAVGKKKEEKPKEEKEENEDIRKGITAFKTLDESSIEAFVTLLLVIYPLPHSSLLQLSCEKLTYR